MKTDEVVESGKPGLKPEGVVVGEGSVTFVFETVVVFRLLLQFSIAIVSAVEDASTKSSLCSLQR